VKKRLVQLEGVFGTGTSGRQEKPDEFLQSIKGERFGNPSEYAVAEGTKSGRGLAQKALRKEGTGETVVAGGIKSEGVCKCGPHRILASRDWRAKLMQT